MLKTEINFRELVPEDSVWASPLLSACGRMACEYSFTTLFMWRNLYHVFLARTDTGLLLMSRANDTVSFLPPIGPSLTRGMELLRQYTEQQGIPLRLHGVDDHTLQEINHCFPGCVISTANPDTYDYLYRTEDLATLPGNGYHGKKNHIAAFSRKYDWQYESLMDDNIDEVIKMSHEWCREKGNCADKGLKSERCAIRELLRDRKRFNIDGGLIRADGKVVAFTFGSPISSSVFDINVEKALPAYADAYAVINREFALRLSSYTYLNREDDMGLEGLRRAKQSYHPTIILKKYSCLING